MALFKSGKEGDVDPFTDLLFNALMTFTFLFFMALLLLNPVAKTGVIDSKAEFIISASWEDNSPNDLDLWVEGPDNKLVWYKHTQDGLMHLDRDDRGMANDMQLVDGKEIINPINQEVVTIRGRSPGEYVVNLHYYRNLNGRPMPVTVYVAEVNPKLEVLHYNTVTLQREGQELTAVRFSIDATGQAGQINSLQKSIVRGGKI